jgi:hypothetical protein
MTPALSAAVERLEYHNLTSGYKLAHVSCSDLTLVLTALKDALKDGERLEQGYELRCQMIDAYDKQNAGLIGLAVAHGWPGDEQAYQARLRINQKLRELGFNPRCDGDAIDAAMKE